MQGYFRNEAATHEVLVRGRLHTGDMGYIDEEGFLYIVGTQKRHYYQRRHQCISA